MVKAFWFMVLACSFLLPVKDANAREFGGVLQLWGAIEFRKELEEVWLLVLNGALSIAFGVILFVQPGAGAVALVWMIGWFAVVFGCLYIALAFRLKKFKQTA